MVLVFQIIKNLGLGLSEDGSSLEMTSNMRDDSLKLWRTRRQRVLYSVTNCAVSLKVILFYFDFWKQVLAVSL